MKKYLLLLLLCSSSIISNAQYDNLVFEGGGAKGIAYAGVAQALGEKGILLNVKKVAGTSAGSIIALMISLGCTPAEIDSMMSKTKIRKFSDGKGGLIGKYARVKKFFGIHKGDAFESWLENLVEQKLGKKSATFSDLHHTVTGQYQDIVAMIYKDFYCIGTNLTRQRSEIFSYETTPSMPLALAVRISCAIPLFYEPVLLDSTGKEVQMPAKGRNYQVYADGGILANYPVNLFDSCSNGGNPLFCDNVKHNYRTLGFKLDRREQVDALSQTTELQPYEINDLNDFMGATMNLMMEALNRKPNLENEKGRTVYIPYSGANTTPPKHMSVKEQKELYDNGKRATELFLAKMKGLED